MVRCGWKDVEICSAVATLAKAAATQVEISIILLCRHICHTNSKLLCAVALYHGCFLNCFLNCSKLGVFCASQSTK